MNLMELTQHESGAVCYEDGNVWIGNWSHVDGIPRQFAGMTVGLNEDLSNAEDTDPPAEAVQVMQEYERQEGFTPAETGFKAWSMEDVTVVVNENWN